MPEMQIIRRTLTPREIFAEQTKQLLQQARGDARTLLGDLFVFPQVPELIVPTDRAAIVERHAKATRPGLYALDEVAHTHCIEEVTRESLARCTFAEQASAIIRSATDKDYQGIIRHCWNSTRDWMERNGADLATVHPASDPQRDVLSNAEAIELQSYTFVPVQWVLPEKSSFATHWQASVVMKQIINVFCIMFVQQWRKEAKGTDQYKRLSEFPSMIQGKGTPESIVRSGLATAISITMSSFQKLCEFIRIACGIEVLDSGSSIIDHAKKRHGSYVAHVASFSQRSITGFQEVTFQKPSSCSDEQLAFLHQWGFVDRKITRAQMNEHNVHPLFQQFLDTYFRMIRTLADIPIFDVKFEQFSDDDLRKLMTSGKKIGCPARGEVMQEMTEWLMELYIKYILPMHRFEESGQEKT